MYELFEHTADLGLRATAPDLDALFAEAAACLFAAILEDPTSARPLTPAAVEIAGTDREYLLFDWLKELLYRFDAEHQVFGRFEVRVRPDGLTATLRAKHVDLGIDPKTTRSRSSLVLIEADDDADADRAPKHAHDILSLLRSPVHIDDGASPSSLAETLGITRGTTTAPLNWLIRHEQVVKSEKGSRVRYFARETKYGTHAA